MEHKMNYQLISPKPITDPDLSLISMTKKELSNLTNVELVGIACTYSHDLTWASTNRAFTNKTRSLILKEIRMRGFYLAGGALGKSDIVLTDDDNNAFWGRRIAVTRPPSFITLDNLEEIKDRKFTIFINDKRVVELSEDHQNISPDIDRIVRAVLKKTKQQR